MSLFRNAARSFVAGFVLLFGVRGVSAMPKAGQMAPEFTLKSQEGGPVSLKDYRGKWIVLYFYPRDMTSGCTIEAHNFQRDSSLYEARNAVVLGVSVDNTESHREFCTKEGLGFKLLADTSAAVSKSYGSVMKIVGTTLSKRNTFLIDPAGKIAMVWTKVSPTKHSNEVLEALDGAQRK